MIRVLGTVLAGLLGLAFGSFLNVCLSRWPEGESIVKPRSHCRECGRTLAWWENVPLVSWIALRGRCRSCGTWIGSRYVIVEAAVGVTWAISVWQFCPILETDHALDVEVASLIGKLILFWSLIALAGLDAENLWLPDYLTLPGIALGFLLTVFLAPLSVSWWLQRLTMRQAALDDLLAIAVAAALILLIRWIYWLVRRREGLGLGDAKLMAMLAAWLGLPGALLAFAIGVMVGAIVALLVLLIPAQKNKEQWGQLKLPLGTFLCIGGIASGLWGRELVAAYMRWAGF